MIIFSWKLAILGCAHVWTNPYLSKSIYSKSFDDCSAASSPRICPTPCRSALDTSRRPLSAVLDPVGPVFQEFLAGQIRWKNKGHPKISFRFLLVVSISVFQRMPDLHCQTWDDDLWYFLPGGVEPHFLTSISPDYDGDPICQEDQEVTVQVEGAKKKHMCPQMSQCLNSFCQSSSFDCFWSLHIYIHILHFYL